MSTTPTPSADYDDWTQVLFSHLGERSLRYLDERVAEAFTSSIAGKTKPGFAIGAYVDEGSYGEVNRYAREEVDRGAQALLFRLYRQPDDRDIARILKNIDAATIGLHCSLRYPGQDPAELFRDLVTYLRREGYQLDQVSGSVDFDPLLDWTDPPFPPLVRLLFFVSRWMPQFKVLQVNAAGFNNGPELADTEIALALAKGAEYLRAIEAHGYPAGLACHHLQFALTVGTSYHVDVAKLRALRTLWLRVLEEFGVTGAPPVVVAAHTDTTSLTDDWAENQDSLRAQAHAAVAGGADLVYLTPLEQVDDTPTLRARKFTMETQQQLQRGFSPIADDEHLAIITEELVAAAWGKYQHLVAQGGFALAMEF